MVQNIGAVGVCGLAFETVWGTYVPPTKFFPILGETLTYKQDTKHRRSIRAIADSHGAVPGNSWIAGDITFEALDDVIPYFMHVSRMSVVKTGTAPYTYTSTPTHAATGSPKVALSIAIQRNAQTFGYVGCIVTGWEFTIEDMVLQCKVSILAKDEATQSNPTPTWPTSVPYGAGMYTLSVGGATVKDADTITFTVDEGAEPIHRLDTQRGPQFIKWGERAVTIKMDRDFDSRVEYDAFKAYTATSVQLLAANGANNTIQMKSAVTIKDSDEINLGGQGDVVRGSFQYTAEYDPATSKAWELVVKTPTENIT